jgi:hypothetical protein
MRRRKPPTHDATAQVRVSSTGLAERPRGHRKLCPLSVCSLLSRCRSWVILDRIGLSASCPVYPRSRPLGRTSRFGSFVKSILPHADEQSALSLSESVRRLQAGLHSFLSMRQIEARRARRDQRFDQSPFVVGQIARISQLAAVVTGAALARPDQ